jgi:hypothetical protein
MKSGNKIILILCGLFLAVGLWAQTKDEKDKKKDNFPGFAVYLGNSDLSAVDLKVSKRVFDSLMKQGLTSRDSSGRPFQFHGFMFTYGERNLYEDSVGNLMVMTDLLNEYCPGNKLSENISVTLFDRTKKGDTAYIDNILLVDDKGKSRKGRGMRIILQ